MAESNPEQARSEQQARSSQSESKSGKDEPRSAAAKALQVDPAEAQNDPYPVYDLMSLDELRSLASRREVSMPGDVEKAHLISALRAADTSS